MHHHTLCKALHKSIFQCAEQTHPRWSHGSPWWGTAWPWRRAAACAAAPAGPCPLRAPAGCRSRPPRFQVSATCPPSPCGTSRGGGAPRTFCCRWWGCWSCRRWCSRCSGRSFSGVGAGVFTLEEEEESFGGDAGRAELPCRSGDLLLVCTGFIKANRSRCSLRQNCEFRQKV